MFASIGRSSGSYGRRSAKLGIGSLALALLASSAAACSETSITLKTDELLARFSVDIADTDAERADGLMFVEEMPMSQGMLFVYESPRPVSFWMRNTLIPLDMVFIGSDGTVIYIHENARPLDETAIFGGDQVQYVLEINGGLASQLGLEVGSVAQHPAIDEEIAAFPCS